MQLTGSLFCETSVDVHDVDDIDGKWPVVIMFDGAGGLGINVTLEVAESLHSQLGNALRSIEHDRQMTQMTQMGPPLDPYTRQIIAHSTQPEKYAHPDNLEIEV